MKKWWPFLLSSHHHHRRLQDPIGGKTQILTFYFPISFLILLDYIRLFASKKENCIVICALKMEDVLCYQGEASMNGIMQEKTDQIPECCSTLKVQCCLLAKYINVSMVMIYPQAISTTPQRIIRACHLFSHTDLV